MKKIDLGIDYDAVVKRIKEEMPRIRETLLHIDISHQQIANVIGKESQRPSIEFIVMVARAAKKPIEYFLFGDTKAFDFYRTQNIIVPEITNQLSDSYQPVISDRSMCCFHEKRLREYTTDYNRLLCIRIIGDTMIPTLKNNNWALIDQSRTAINDGLVYALTFKDSRFIQLRLSFPNIRSH